MIIGITGPAGAGKSTLAQYLVDNFNFKHISVREYLSYRLNEKKLPITRDNLVKIANQLRKDNGSDYIISELYEEALKYPNSVIESIRTPGEVIT